MTETSKQLEISRKAISASSETNSLISYCKATSLQPSQAFDLIESGKLAARLVDDQVIIVEDPSLLIPIQTTNELPLSSKEDLRMLLEKMNHLESKINGLSRPIARSKLESGPNKKDNEIRVLKKKVEDLQTLNNLLSTRW
ncbi:MAG: hypothetical protein HRU19_11060 [Pseudobacteriovorax sp.]|nr:hypothetical protein [Pseudobacteriovorax sp.]